MRKIVISILGLLAVAVVLAHRIGEHLFDRKVRKEVRALIDAAEVRTRSVSTEDLGALPEPVRRYFRCAGIDGRCFIRFAGLRHTGTFRTGEGRRWMPVEGEEYFTTDPPSYIWYASLNAAPGIRIKVRDTYHKGEGNVLAKAFSLVTLADAKGREMDMGSLIRFLSEMPLVPTALLPDERLRWEEIDSDSARVTIRHHSLEASAVFHFDAEGRITRVVADRYMMVGNAYSKERWTGYFRRYEEMDSMKVPMEFEAVWTLSSGDLSYAKFHVTHLEYDNPSMSETG